MDGGREVEAAASGIENTWVELEFLRIEYPCGCLIEVSFVFVWSTSCQGFRISGYRWVPSLGAMRFFFLFPDVEPEVVHSIANNLKWALIGPDLPRPPTLTLQTLPPESVVGGLVLPYQSSFGLVITCSFVLRDGHYST